MAGRMGGKVRTAMNRRIEGIDPERNLIFIRGSVPGARNNIVLIRTA
jgi:large subunit ribosomal protein L3